MLHINRASDSVNIKETDIKDRGRVMGRYAGLVKKMEVLNEKTKLTAKEIKDTMYRLLEIQTSYW